MLYFIRFMNQVLFDQYSRVIASFKENFQIGFRKPYLIASLRIFRLFTIKFMGIFFLNFFEVKIFRIIILIVMNFVKKLIFHEEKVL